MNINSSSLLVFSIFLGLAGCSDTPSSAAARSKLENQIQQQSGGLIKLISFQKTDGVMHEIMGMKAYEMSYAGEVEFLDDCLWSGGNNLSGWDGSFSAQRGPAAPSGGLRDFFNLSQGRKAAKKGEHFRFTGHMDFQKTERGWRDNDGNLLLSPADYAAASEQTRVVQEQQAARERAARDEQDRQKRLEEEREQARRKALITKRDKIMGSVRAFLSRGTTLKGTRRSDWGYRHKDPMLPVEITITGDLTVENNPDRQYWFNQTFKVPAHYKWLREAESIVNSSWGMDIREYDGMFAGSIELNDKVEPPDINVSMNYYVHDGSFKGEWNTKGNRIQWNGKAFHGEGYGTLDLQKQ
jgi:hypothetical protein